MRIRQRPSWLFILVSFTAPLAESAAQSVLQLDSIAHRHAAKGRPADYREAIRVWRQALSAAKSANDMESLPIIYGNMGSLWNRLGVVDSARVTLESAYLLASTAADVDAQSGVPILLPIVSELVLTYSAMSETEKAVQLIRMTYETANAAGGNVRASCIRSYHRLVRTLHSTFETAINATSREQALTSLTPLRVMLELTQFAPNDDYESDGGAGTCQRADWRT
jgi:hypothetical protein